MARSRSNKEPKRKERKAPRADSKPPGRLRRAWGVARKAVPPREEWRAARPAFLWAIGSALLLRLAWEPADLSPVAFVALVPLFWGVRRCRSVMAFWVGWLFATIMGLFGVYWFVSVARFNPFVWLGILPLAMYVGAHFAAAVALIVYFARRLAPWAALGAAMITWAAVEFWFGIGALGMPYGLAQSQGGWPAMAQVVSLAGMPLLSALIVGANLAGFETVAAFKARYGQGPALLRLGTMLALVVAAWIYGSGVIAKTERLYGGEDAFPVRVALVQPNIDQELKYESYRSPDPAKRRRLQDQLTQTVFEALRGIEQGSADLIVTPESTFTADFIDVEEEIQDEFFGGAVMRETIGIAADLGGPIMIGGVDNVFLDEGGELTERALSDAGTLLETGAVYGGLWLIRPTDERIQFRSDYRKIQLMPFGETVPYLWIIPGFQEKIVQVGTFNRGKLGEPVGFLVERPSGETDEVRIGPSICFEDQFPYIHRHFAGSGANLFVNSTNDAWFDGSAGPGWHAEMARWRSIETRLPMVRCTNTGVTCVIGPTGEIQEEFPVRERGVLQAGVAVLPDPPRTLYTRIGGVFGLLSLLSTAGLLIFLIRRDRREQAAP